MILRSRKKNAIIAVALSSVLLLTGCMQGADTYSTAAETPSTTLETMQDTTFETEWIANDCTVGNTEGVSETTDSPVEATKPTFDPDTEATDEIEIKPTEPSEVPTVPAETTPVTADPEETVPDVEAGMSFTEVNETVYANATVNIRKGPSTNYEKISSLKWGESIIRIGRGDHGWDKVLYNDEPAYMYSKYIQTEEPVATPAVTYPLSYSDNSCTITVSKEWFENAWCYIAHLEFTDYTRFGMECAKGKYDSGYETTSHAAKRIGAILAVNGDYTTPEMGNDVVRNGVVWKNTQLHSAAIYNANTGLFSDIGSIGYQWTEDLVANGQLTDTFSFFRWNLVNGDTLNSDNSSRAQRTSIGTTGKAGDIYIVVSEGRYADGESAGLTFNQCARLMKSLGCTFAIPLDGGGSSTMYFNGKVLNSADKNERAVVDFVVFR